MRNILWAWICLETWTQLLRVSTVECRNGRTWNTVTEWTVWGFQVLWPSLIWRCLVSRLVLNVSGPLLCPKDLFQWRVYWKFHALSALHWFFLCFVFSRLGRGPDPLVLSPMIVNWILISSAYFEPTFSTPDTFQVPVLIEIYDKARVIWRIKAGFRIFLIDFMPFFIFCIGVGSIAVTIKIYMAFFVSWTSFSWLKFFFKKSCWV